MKLTKFDNGPCKIETKLDQVHEWAHRCLDALDPDELHQAHALGTKILDMLNELSDSNGLKFIALFEALAVGADVLEHHRYEMTHPGTVTIH